MMNSQRIQSEIDVTKMQQSHLTVVGGAYGIGCDLARCWLGSIACIDFDRVDPTNPARQDLNSSDIGSLKVEAASAMIQRANPQTEVSFLPYDFCSLTPEFIDAHLGHTDLLVMATDFFPAQARGNIESLRLRKPAVFIGLYAGGRAGEIIYHVPGGPTEACYRCIASSRYAAFGRQSLTREAFSSGGTILDLHLVDAIAGQICAGILTRGADNRLGRLIDQLGNRNLLQVKMDPEYKLGERDIFREYLGDHPANFSFNTIALPMEAEKDCPDCSAYRC